MIYGDEQRLTIGGAGARVICAANRPLDAPYPVTTGADAHGDFTRFETMAGDLSAEEAQFYRSHLKDAPKRAFASFESQGREPSRRGKLLVQRFGLVVEKGPPLVPNFHTVLAQWNAAPGPNLSWRPPPAEFGIAVLGRTRQREDGKIVAVKDPITRKQIFDEWLQLKGHVFVPETGKVAEVGRIRTAEPLERGRFYREVEIRFADGQGGDGTLELLVDGESKGVYRGELGYAGYGVPYPAFGMYQSFVQPSAAARFYGWREAVEAVT